MIKKGPKKEERKTERNLQTSKLESTSSPGANMPRNINGVPVCAARSKVADGGGWGLLPLLRREGSTGGGRCALGGEPPRGRRGPRRREPHPLPPPPPRGGRVVNPTRSP